MHLDFLIMTSLHVQKIATQRRSDESLLTDISDGAKLYQGEGFLFYPNNISFIVNTGKGASLIV